MQIVLLFFAALVARTGGITLTKFDVPSQEIEYRGSKTGDNSKKDLVEKILRLELTDPEGVRQKDEDVKEEKWRNDQREGVNTEIVHRGHGDATESIHRTHGDTAQMIQLKRSMNVWLLNWLKTQYRKRKQRLSHHFLGQKGTWKTKE